MYEAPHQIPNDAPDELGLFSVEKTPPPLDFATKWFEAEVLPLSAVIRCYLSERCGHPTDVEDMHQEILLRAYEVSTRAAPAHVRHFWLKIANDVLAERKETNIGTTVALTAAYALSDPTPSQEHKVTSRQNLELFLDVFSCLPSEMRHAILLNRIGGLTQRDIAQRMGVSERAADRLLGLGMRHLTKAYRRCLK